MRESELSEPGGPVVKMQLLRDYSFSIKRGIRKYIIHTQRMKKNNIVQNL